MRDDNPFSNDPAQVTWSEWAAAMAEDRFRIPPRDELPVALQIMVTFRCGGIDCSTLLPEGKTFH